MFIFIICFFVSPCLILSYFCFPPSVGEASSGGALAVSTFLVSVENCDTRYDDERREGGRTAHVRENILGASSRIDHAEYTRNVKPVSPAFIFRISMKIHCREIDSRYPALPYSTAAAGPGSRHDL